jgi:hypothetical protein
MLIPSTGMPQLQSNTTIPHGLVLMKVATQSITQITVPGPPLKSHLKFQPIKAMHQRLTKIPLSQSRPPRESLFHMFPNPLLTFPQSMDQLFLQHHINQPIFLSLMTQLSLLSLKNQFIHHPSTKPLLKLSLSKQSSQQLSQFTLLQFKFQLLKLFIHHHFTNQSQSQ